MPVKVEQINEYLFSDTVLSQKTKSGSDEISQGQNLTIHNMPFPYLTLFYLPLIPLSSTSVLAISIILAFSTPPFLLA